ncbi:hypothetical protein [Methylobacterium komagatae]
MSTQALSRHEDYNISDPERLITESELEPLLDALARFPEGSGLTFQALFHQARVNSIVCALLPREMTKAGLINPMVLKQGALATDVKLEPPGSGERVAKVITSLFGGEPMSIPPQVMLRVTQGSLGQASETVTPKQAEDPGDLTM